MSEFDEMGPIDWMLVEFDRPFSGELAPPLLDLIDRGLIRLLDMMFISKDADGTVQAIEISDMPGDEAVHVEAFDGIATGLLGEDDLVAAGEALEAGTRAIMFLYENTWAAPFAIAMRNAGGLLLDSGRIPVQQILAALEELDAADAAS
jgi:hypothetical protein